MNENLGLMGALAVSMALVIGFFIFAHRTGVLAAFGRHPLSWRKIGATTVAAFMPAMGGFGSLLLSGLPGVTEYPELLAIGMAMLGWFCTRIYNVLARISMAPQVAE